MNRPTQWLLSLIFTGLLGLYPAYAQILKPFPAIWVGTVHMAEIRPEVVYFAKNIDLNSVPDSLVVRLAADQGYELFVNGKMVRRAHNSGDLLHYPYQEVNLAPSLKPGSNQVIMLVWHHGKLAQDALTTYRLAFWMESKNRSFSAFDSGKDWVYRSDSARRFTRSRPMSGYYHAGPLEAYHADKARILPTLRQDLSLWSPVTPAGAATPAQYIYSGPWRLVKDSLPPMSEQQAGAQAQVLDSPHIRTDYSPSQGIDYWKKGIPAHSRMRILFDAGTLVTAYPKWKATGGRGARITLRYDEALFLQAQGSSKPGKTYVFKQNRTEVAGKELKGYVDTLFGTSGSWQFRPLWWRTFRYIEVCIETGDEPIQDLHLEYWVSHYPFSVNRQVSLRSAQKPQWQALAQKINEVGIRTLDACAHETFMDCPYYEQSQYVGDTRIEGLVSYLAHGDETLWRQSIIQFFNSRGYDGLVLSRAPSDLVQKIPGFALWWIGMVYDYAQWTGDSALVHQVWPGVLSVLEYYSRRQNAEGRIAYPGHWGFVDWCWPNGIPPQDEQGYAALHDLSYSVAYQYARQLSGRYGLSLGANRPGLSSERLLDFYYSPEKQALRDVAGKDVYSEHSQILFALLSHLEEWSHQAASPRVIQAREQLPIFAAREVSGLTPASIYFKFYEGEVRALQSSWAQAYFSRLRTWQHQLALNLSTWAETPEPSRSDCHAWGSSPNYHFYTTILGVKHTWPISEGRQRALFGPDSLVLQPALYQQDSVQGQVRLVRLDEVQGELALRKGFLKVHYQFLAQKPKSAEAIPTLGSLVARSKGGWLVRVVRQGICRHVLLRWADGRQYEFKPGLGEEVWVPE